MSNFVIGVGGSGAKFTVSLLHLAASGLLGGKSPELRALLVDPDENNGNVEECKRLAAQYRDCRDLLKTGQTDLFSASFQVEGPWTPIARPDLDSLEALFQYADLKARDDVDAELLDLLFEPEELALSLKQGFRGRPAIGSTVFANSVNFSAGAWKRLTEEITQRGAQGPVRVMLSGSVFGGSGASGVPTLVRLLETQIRQNVKDLRIGLSLFLPYFRFRPVEGERVQADPAAFPIATAEALRYYYERNYLGICHSIYAVGEEIPAEMAVSAIGAQEQRNEPHLVELVAAAGALRFFNEQQGVDRQLAVAGRAVDGTLTWDDLPFDTLDKAAMVRKLQRMALFAVAYKFVFHPLVEKGLSSGTKWPGWVDHVEREKIPRDQVGRATAALRSYVDSFLLWLMHTSNPRRQGFEAGMVNPTVFAEPTPTGWRLKDPASFRDEDLGKLLRNRPAKSKVDSRSIFDRSGQAVRDPTASGPGKLVRAIYDACEID